MRRLAFGTLAAATTLAAALMAAPASAVAEQQQAGAALCPSGYVCIYPDTSANGVPAKYYRYGSYNLSNVFGNRLVVNNQTGGAGLRLCSAYGGQNCGVRLGPGNYVVNLSPINSILLEP
jgi:hypothetical protein